MKLRDTKGRFRKRVKVLPAVIILLAVTGIAYVLPKDTIKYEAIHQVAAIDTLGARYEKKVEELKQGVLDSLASCETNGVKEPNAAIILDTNNKMSIGRYMYQITTVQHYVKVFYEREIDRREAILIALDSGSVPLDELTEKIIFEDSKGIGNWHNCNKKNGLSKEIEVIKKLDI